MLNLKADFDLICVIIKLFYFCDSLLKLIYVYLSAIKKLYLTSVQYVCAISIDNCHGDIFFNTWILAVQITE